jgi:hypothetical protein
MNARNTFLFENMVIATYANRFEEYSGEEFGWQHEYRRKRLLMQARYAKAVRASVTGACA